jgi:hypothetical protein
MSFRSRNSTCGGAGPNGVCQYEVTRDPQYGDQLPQGALSHGDDRSTCRSPSGKVEAPQSEVGGSGPQRSVGSARLLPNESHGETQPLIMAANCSRGYGAINSVTATVLDRDYTIRLNGARPASARVEALDGMSVMAIGV